jgi:hypothetical protein
MLRALTLSLALASAVGAAACTGMVGKTGGTTGSDDQDAADAGPADSSAADAPPIDAPLPGVRAIARGMLWVAAEVPYCQAANHAPDGDSSCAATCTRPDMPDWDPYRSDCSGFVSWAWALPAPGRITTDFAPFTTDITHAIDGSDLRPGDALNNDEHVILFEEWTVAGKTAKLMEEPGCSSATPYAHEFTSDVTIDGQSVTVTYSGTYTAIRYDDAP